MRSTSASPNSCSCISRISRFDSGKPACSLAIPCGDSFELVDAREHAELSIEVRGRNRDLFSRDVTLRIHHPGVPAEDVFRYYVGGRFTDLADTTLGLLATWWAENHVTAPVIQSAETMGQSFRVFLDVRDLHSIGPEIRANAAARLGTRKASDPGTTSELIALLADTAIVRQYDIRTNKSLGRTTVGAVAGLTLVQIGRGNDVVAALTGDSRDGARINAASVLHTIANRQAAALLQAAARDDRSPKVRKAIERLLTAAQQKP